MLGRDNYLYSRGYFLNWFVLAFTAGTVNAGGFIACQRFVTHLTGFATQFGVDFADQQWTHALSMLSVPGFFLGGTMVSGFLVERRLAKGLVPYYGWAMSLVTATLCLAAFGGWRGWFGVFGEPLEVRKDYALLALLCLGSGIQNAVVTSVSGTVVRTTHVTGMTTDLGIGIVRVLFPTPDEKRLKRQKRLIKLRMGLIASFMAGCTIGAVLCGRFGYGGFVLPAGLAMVSSISAFLVWQKPKPDSKVEIPEAVV